MTQFKYSIKRAKLMNKSNAAFWAGKKNIKKYWDKKILRLDEKFYAQKIK